MGMKVIFYDITKKLALGNSEYKELDELLANSDFVTLHVPETDETKYMFNEKELLKIKKGGYLINASRGTVIVIEDLVKVMKSKHLKGCAIDVFPQEPSSNKEEFVSPLQGVEDVILTPHIGGSTIEAQVNIGLEVSNSLINFFKTGASSGSTNFPELELSINQNSFRIMNVHKNEPGVLSKINSIIAQANTNIESQFLSTDDAVGYLVVDVNCSKAEELMKKIDSEPYSIKTRIVNN
jgi:D-3-phosphoglycerate dehydrogenase